ncbi:hypothetical protein K3N28_19375, partial [Glycomyces sp. TRM65418]|uniref:hypothetical protein n=1 Tax=Glycomyces sp. TRM65418 TaxID=2867006 RepID=UPI001D15ED4A
MTLRRSLRVRTDDLGMRVLKICMVGGMLLLVLADALSSGTGTDIALSTPMGWIETASGLFAIGVYMRYRPGRKHWIGYVAIVSIAVTALEMAVDTNARPVGVAELIALGVLMLYAVRQWDAPPGRWVAPAVAAAATLLGLRLFEGTGAGANVGGTIMILLALSTI